jgi:YegS/Rv2252/BmrU family lipid kinase
LPTARVILNPTSGAGRGERAAEQIIVGLESRGIDADLVATTGPREGVRMALEAARSRVDLVIAAGGDGTIHEVANGLLTAYSQGVDGPTLGILPVGTGNDFAKLVGPLDDLDRSMDILVEGELRRFDACTAEWGDNSHWCINAAGTGIDVDVTRHIMRKRGRRSPAVWKYLTAVLRSLMTFRAIPVRIHLDDAVIDEKVMIVVVANGRCIGGGFWVCPSAEPDDGMFDICLIEEVSILGAMVPLAQVMKGKHENHPRVQTHRSREVVFEATGPDPIFFQLDGELHEPPDARSITFRMHPNALPVMTEKAQG